MSAPREPGFLALYLRVLGLLGPERRLAIGLALANVAAATLAFAEPVLFGRVIDLLGRGDAADWGETVATLALWGGIALAGIVAAIWIALQADRLAHRRRLGALGRFFDHVLSLPKGFHGARHSGGLLKVMLTGADHMFGLWLTFLREHLATFTTLLVLLPLTLLLNWRLALLLLGLVALFAALTFLVIGRTEQAQRRIERVHTEIAARAGDAFANVLLLQSFARLQAETERFQAAARQVLAAQYPVLTWWALVNILTRAAGAIALVAIFALGALLNREGRASVGEIVTFMGFAILVIAKLEHAMGFASRVFFDRPALIEFFAVLDTPSSVPERPDAASPARVAGHVRFEAVTYAYDPNRPAARGLDLDAPPGTTVAIVGPTGAGKSTAMALLQRHVDPDSGRVTIDGIDLRDLKLDALRRAVGVVSQDAPLLARPIAENLRLARPDASMTELEAAARRAQALDFILAQPQGWDTPIGERGATLSGGERQRLAIARALLKDPPILILDEATSALDAETERKVQLALAEAARGRTTFIVAHRLSTIRGADLVLVLDQGRIVERGRFGELAAAGGLFARLVQAQLGGDSAG